MDEPLNCHWLKYYHVFIQKFTRGEYGIILPVMTQLSYAVTLFAKERQ